MLSLFPHIVEVASNIRTESWTDLNSTYDQPAYVFLKLGIWAENIEVFWEDVEADGQLSDERLEVPGWMNMNPPLS